MKYLKSVDIWKGQISYDIFNEDANEIINEISKTNNFEWSISYSTEIKHLNKWSLRFPKQWEYSIDEFNCPENWDELNTLLCSELKDKWLSDISNLKISSIYLCFTLSSADLSFTLVFI